jgi:hypothetical protein
LKYESSMIWDESNKNAHWQNRKDKTQPFFAIFSLKLTHECCIILKEKQDKLTKALPAHLRAKPETYLLITLTPPKYANCKQPPARKLTKLTLTGGKIISSKMQKGSTRMKIAFRHVANAIGNLKESIPLRDFFMRINFRKGRVSAVSATARKLAVIIWNMVTKGTQYVNPEGYLFLDQKRKQGLVKRIKKQITKFDLTNEDLGFSIS